MLQEKPSALKREHPVLNFLDPDRLANPDPDKDTDPGTPLDPDPDPQHCLLGIGTLTNRTGTAAKG